MNETTLLLQLLGYTASKMENEIIQEWINWCTDKSYVTNAVTKTKDGLTLSLEVSEPDLQNLLADTILFNYWKTKYADCILNFLTDVNGMNPKPDVLQARLLFKRRVAESYRFYNTDIIHKARTKKIVNHGVK